MDVLAFQRKWIDAARQKERSAYVTHFNDLCDLLGVEQPLDADPTGERYGFERGSKVGKATKRLNELRERWLNLPGTTDAELKKRMLTNLYNARPTWLVNAQAGLDRAVWDAYGWPEDEVPAEVEEDVILSRLLALNGSGRDRERNAIAGAESRCGRRCLGAGKTSPTLVVPDCRRGGLDRATDVRGRSRARGQWPPASIDACRVPWRDAIGCA